MSHKKTVIGQEKKPFEEATSKLKNIILTKLDRLFGTYGRVWYFLGIQTLFFTNGYENQLSKKALIYRFKNFHFVPETFLKIQWEKKVLVHIPTGHVLNKPHSEIEVKAHNIPVDKDLYFAQERRYLYLYSPWLIETYYHCPAEDKKVVATDEDGFQTNEIETHEFSHCVQRKKYPWWNSYRIFNRFQNDETQFGRDLDKYICGGY
tara:strand:- start:66 stop:683 length:618 start_codon:yes stop_codon:yes gene_type:complete